MKRFLVEVTPNRDKYVLHSLWFFGLFKDRTMTFSNWEEVVDAVSLLVGKNRFKLRVVYDSRTSHA